jgi:hypothetical protein
MPEETNRERPPLQPCQECGRIRRLIHCPDTGRWICPDCHPRVAIEDGEARILESPRAQANATPEAATDGGQDRQATVHEAARKQDGSLADLDVDIADSAQDATDPNAPADSGGGGDV